MIIISLLAVITLVLILVNRKVNLGVALILGGIILSLLNGVSLNDILKILGNTITNKLTITLVLTIVFITIMGNLMEKYKLLDRMIESLEHVVRSAKITIMITPALIGLLLVTGGALMSCPIVDNLGEKLNLPKDKRAAINMLFRHGLYFVYPLSAAMILSTELGGFNVWDFIKVQAPIAVVMYVVGYFVLFKGIKNPGIKKINVKEYINNIISFIIFSLPISISIVASAILHQPFYMTLPLGILISIIIHLIDIKRNDLYKTKESLFQLIIKGINFKMVGAVFGILVFRGFINNLDELFLFLNSIVNTGIPIELIIIISCGILSFSLASIQPSIAILFPLILPLAATYDLKVLYAMLIFSSGYIAYYISPLHLCQVLTLEYFDVDIKRLYKNYKIIIPVTYAFMIIYYFILK